MGSVANPNTLRPARATRSHSSNITVPRDLAGDAYIIVVTDAGNVVREFPLDGNNQASARMEIDPIPPPDLIVSGVSATRESFSGQIITVQWTVLNQGPGVTDPEQWIDYVYLSSTPNGTDYFLGAFPHQGALKRDESYIRVEDVRLPEQISGTFFVTVLTDALNNVFEFTFETPDHPQNKDGNNLGTTAAPVNVILRPPPDLEVVSAQGPSTARGGDTITVNWSVLNRGSENTGVSSWTDTVYLSADDKLDGGDIALGSVTHQGSLNVGAGYTLAGNFRLPNYVGGNYLIVKVDSGNGVFEGPFEGNNVFVIPCVVTPLQPPVPPPPPDLEITSANVPVQGFSSQPLGLSWTVTNHGPGAVGAQGWTDGVYLSKDATLSANDTQIAAVGNFGPLAMGQTYSHSLSAKRTASGRHFRAVLRPPGDRRIRESRRGSRGGRRTEQRGRDPDPDHLHRARPGLQGRADHADPDQLGRGSDGDLDCGQRGEPEHDPGRLDRHTLPVARRHDRQFRPGLLRYPFGSAGSRPDLHPVRPGPHAHQRRWNVLRPRCRGRQRRRAGVLTRVQQLRRRPVHRDTDANPGPAGRQCSGSVAAPDQPARPGRLDGDQPGRRPHGRRRVARYGLPVARHQSGPHIGHPDRPAFPPGHSRGRCQLRSRPGLRGAARDQRILLRDRLPRTSTTRSSKAPPRTTTSASTRTRWSSPYPRPPTCKSCP